LYIQLNIVDPILFRLCEINSSLEYPVSKCRDCCESY